MNQHSRLYAVISYITWIGWIVALLLREKSDTLVRRHLNQALLLNIVSTAASVLSRLGGLFATIGSVVGLATFVLLVMGIVRAVKCSEEPLPFVGEAELIQ